MTTPAALLSSRERVIWTGAFVLVASVIVFTHFTSKDPDSALYASLGSRLSALPPSQWIAPQWWGFWNGDGLFRDHPAGLMAMSAAASRLGIPAEQAAFVIGVGAGLLSLLLIGRLLARLTTPDTARASLVLLQIMPVAFIFRVRANHEYPMLVCMLCVLLGLDAVRTSWRWLILVVLALGLALVIKDVFVAPILLAATLWVLMNPTRSDGPAWRAWLTLAFAVGGLALIVTLYDAAYLRATGETFWGPYLERWIAPTTSIAPGGRLLGVLQRLGFYLSRVIWQTAPWSLLLIWAAWRRASGARLGAWGLGAKFFLTFASVAVVALSVPSLFSERYGFTATYSVAIASVIGAWHAWPVLRDLVMRLDRAVPALPAVLWFTLVMVRLVAGQWLPRIQP